jgi:hypothetical protein
MLETKRLMVKSPLGPSPGCGLKGWTSLKKKLAPRSEWVQEPLDEANIDGMQIIYRIAQCRWVR